MELESKLAAYRAKKKREEKINKLKESFKNFVSWNIHKDENRSEQQDLLHENPSSESEQENSKVTATPNVNISDDEPKKADEEISLFTKGIYATGFIIWSLLYYVFIQLQFGIIFLIISALFGIYFNTRTGPKDKSEISAYSVFNKNCESIDGTLKAEQFEREIRFGAQSVH